MFVSKQSSAMAVKTGNACGGYFILPWSQLLYLPPRSGPGLIEEMPSGILQDQQHPHLWSQGPPRPQVLFRCGPPTLPTVALQRASWDSCLQGWVAERHILVQSSGQLAAGQPSCCGQPPCLPRAGHGPHGSGLPLVSSPQAAWSTAPLSAEAGFGHPQSLSTVCLGLTLASWCPSFLTRIQEPWPPGGLRE